MPTLLDRLSLPAPGGLHGRTLLGAEVGGRLIGFESWYAQLHYGWSRLRGLTDGRYKLIDAPRPELYLLERDPSEERDLSEAEAPRRERLQAALERHACCDATAAAPALSAEESAGLRALGYAGTTSSSGAGPLPDPKDKIAVYRQLEAAEDAAAAGANERAVELLGAVIAAEPALPDAHQALGDRLLDLGRLRPAIESYRETLRLRPADSNASLSLGLALERAGRIGEALDAWGRAVLLDPANSQAWYQLARVHFEARRWGPAAEALERSIAADSILLELLPDLARAQLELGQLERAEATLRRALRDLGERAGLRQGLAQVAERRGDLDGAVREYEAALQLAPAERSLRRALAEVLERRGKPGDRERAAELRRKASSSRR
jgi:tetratricopeptide (TPR) repeat protein